MTTHGTAWEWPDLSPWLPKKLRPRVPCKAHRTNGNACRAWAMHGQEVCWSHGGASPQARNAAMTRLAKAAYVRACAQAVAGVHALQKQRQELAAQVFGEQSWN